MLGKELQMRRLRINLTQAALAERMGVTVTTVARWEQGQRAIPRMAELFFERIEREAQTQGSCQASPEGSLRARKPPSTARKSGKAG